MVNRILVERITIQQALEDFDIQKAFKFLRTTLPINLFNFPLSETMNETSGTILKRLQLSKSAKGAIVGVIYTTLTFPLGYYRESIVKYEPDA